MKLRIYQYEAAFYTNLVWPFW